MVFKEIKTLKQLFPIQSPKANLKIITLQRTNHNFPLNIPMNIDNFNQILSKISTTYQETLSLRQQLSQYSNEQIIESIEKSNKQKGTESGWVSREMIVQWMREVGQQEGKGDDKVCAEEVAEMFPFEKISYTVLIATCLKRIPIEKEQSSTKNPNPIDNPLFLITRFISNQLQMMKVRKQLIPLIQLYIPMSGTNLTLQQFKDYLLMGNTSNKKRHPIDPTYVMLALNGDGGSGDRLDFQMYNKKKQEKQGMGEKENSSFKKDSSANSMAKIREIMGRLNNRVDSFGNEWLMNRPIEKNNFYQEVATNQKN